MSDYPPLRPMQTAPRDGTPIFAAFPNSDSRVIKWSGWGGGVWDNDSGYHISDEPLGWRPMPPKEKGYWMADPAKPREQWGWVGEEGTLAKVLTL